MVYCNLMCDRWTVYRRCYKDHSGYALSHLEATLQCNAPSHWLSPYLEWSPRYQTFLRCHVFLGSVTYQDCCILLWQYNNTDCVVPCHYFNMLPGWNSIGTLVNSMRQDDKWFAYTDIHICSIYTQLYSLWCRFCKYSWVTSIDTKRVFFVVGN